MCHPFKPYDLEMKKDIDILEIPLIVTDTSLLKISIGGTWNIIRRLVEIIQENNRLIVIL